MVQLQDLADDLWVAIVFALSEFIVEDNDVGLTLPSECVSHK